jgi:hypothetical protein
VADLKAKYGADGQAIACSLASLGSSATAGRASAAIDNSTNLFLDALVFLQVRTGSGAIGNDKAVYVYAWGIVDATAGPTYPDAVTGSDAAVTLNDPTQLPLLGVVFCPAATTTYKAGPWSVASCFGGVLPQKWGIVVRNYTGIALSATEGDHKKLYQGILAQIV